MEIRWRFDGDSIEDWVWGVRSRHVSDPPCDCATWQTRHHIAPRVRSTVRLCHVADPPPHCATWQIHHSMHGGAVGHESAEATLDALAARRGSVLGALGRASKARFSNARRSVGSAISLSRAPSSFSEPSAEGAASPGPGQGSRRHSQQLSMSPTPMSTFGGGGGVLSSNVFCAITGSPPPSPRSPGGMSAGGGRPEHGSPASSS